MKRSDDGFLGRWSRRKRAREDERATEETAPESEAEAEAPPLPEAEAEPAPPPTLSEEELAALPRIEDLREGSDIRAFLNPAVPRALRAAALRKVWMLTPAIRDYKNPAVDYAWDWNTPGGVPGDGCAPSPERMAQMLRDLVAPRTPVEPTATETDIAAPAEAAPDPAPPPPDDTPQAIAEAPADPPPPPQPEDAPAPRRHGGARPA